MRDLDPVLVQTIVRAVLAQLGASDAACACHSARDGCCPDRMGRLLGHGADRFGLQAAGHLHAGGLARLIDHTLLKPDATREQIEALCGEAREHGFATVCVNPVWVKLCAELLRGSETLVCTVVGFPLGATLPEVKAAETRRVVADGACEVDMVLNVGALKSGDYRLAERDVAGVVAAAGGRLVKVIIEAALLSDDEKVKACVVAKAAGAHFVKTSTGFGPGGATAADVALMRRVVGAEMGVKAAGGVRDLQSARAMIDAGADRIGASVGVKIVQESRGTAPAAPGPAASGSQSY
jgi:deoxyribose-phosphate aldolase